SAVLSNETFGEIYDQLAGLIKTHNTTLIFVNTRRLAERAARHLADRLGEDAVTAHHGSLAREHRLEAEQRLKNGTLRALVATASLELGIDIGAIDLVCQIGSPRAIATLLQRVGRSGHAAVGGDRPKGRLFPLSRDDLAECTALLDAVRRGELDAIRIPVAPLDVLAQQIVAEVAASGECDEAALFNRYIMAWPYRDLTRKTFTAVVRMLADGATTRRGRRAAHIHRDAVNARLRPRKSARLTALTNGGVIPEQFDYEVILSPVGFKVGTLNEDFAFESLPGDIFQLGNTSYRILKVESGRVIVEDAKGQPPNIPFWFGEAPGRTDELSAAVSRLRIELEQRLTEGGSEGVAAACGWLEQELRIPAPAARQLADYYGASRAALGVLPTQRCIVFERFFDEIGDMHLIVHSPFGSRLNRAWGLALRKRFCRKFNFELQAAALEDSIVLSLGATHSFMLEEVAGYLGSATVRNVLTQATLDAPMFGNRWRWNATIALTVRRNFKGKRAPAQFQRSDAEDLLAVVFPDQLACAENLIGARAIPDHPLVNQTLADCLQETMDIEGLEALLKRLEAGELEVIGRDLPTPSPLAEEIINARNYAFLDDGAQEERRTLAVRSGGYWNAEDTGQTQLDSTAIERVQEEAWPDPCDADELHDALVMHGFLTRAEGEHGGSNPIGPADDLNKGWSHLFEILCNDRRATSATLPGGQQVWIAAERLSEFQVLFADLKLAPQIEPVVEAPPPVDDHTEALRELLRSRLEGLGPVTLEQLTAPLGLPESAAAMALAQLEAEGFAIQGCFNAAAVPIQWCERRLLARIHRYILQRRRRAIEPVSPQDYMRFLLGWHGLLEGMAGDRVEGVDALTRVLAMLEGFSLPAAIWESDVLPARLADYTPQMLDALCTSGRIAWLRLNPPQTLNGKRRASPVRNTPIALIARSVLPLWRELAPAPPPEVFQLGVSARKLLEVLDIRGASFFHELQEAAGLLRAQTEDGLAELAAWGLVSADSFAGLRALISRGGRRPAHAPRTRIKRRRFTGLAEAGRWARLCTVESVDSAGRRLTDGKTLEHIAWTLLARYGVVFKRVLERESNLPVWCELLYIYRRLEARGEIRGGRFVDGFAGEQFAAPEALAALRKARKAEPDGAWVCFSAADPLNLVGIITPGERFPAVSGNRVLLRDGVPAAFYEGGKVRFASEYDPETQWNLRNHLLRRARPAQYRPESHLAT
ncbi:MAG: winged helix DNA-binding domain-containing protein, partial [Nitrococcus mobilis]|nr:winged helix DNA-binding domain-containing protein [Nitrococcus mobilis]